MRLHLPSCWGGVGNYIFLSGPPRTTTSSTSSSASGVRLRFGVDFGSALTSVRQPFDGLPELMLCFASAPTSVPFPSWCCASVRRPISDDFSSWCYGFALRHLRFGGHYLYWLPSSILTVEEEDNTTWLLLCLFPRLLWGNTTTRRMLVLQDEDANDDDHILSTTIYVVSWQRRRARRRWRCNRPLL